MPLAPKVGGTRCASAALSMTAQRGIALSGAMAARGRRPPCGPNASHA